MTHWQSKLKDNETRVRELTASQQNLAAISDDQKSSQSKSMPRSTSVANGISNRPLAQSNKSIRQSVPLELHKVRQRQQS